MPKSIALLVGAGALAACAQQQAATPLAQLGASQIEIVANGRVNVLLHVDETAGCPRLADDAHALFDGQPMKMSYGGWDENASGCYPIGFWFDKPDTDTMVGFERQNASAQLVITDSSAAWSVQSGQLFATDFINDAANSQIVWTDVQHITSALVFPPATTTIEGNIIHYPAGHQIDWVQATSHPVPTRCEGPAVCTVDLQGTHDWKASP